jgi:hypothetical protein
MKKTNKEHPITFFRKANEARQKLVKKSMGGPGDPPDETPTPKPIGATASFGNFEGGFKGDLTGNKISNSTFNAAYNNPKTGLGVNASYTPENKRVSAGVNYNTTIGKNKTPVKLGLTYNKKGGSVKRKK